MGWVVLIFQQKKLQPGIRHKFFEKKSSFFIGDPNTLEASQDYYIYQLCKFLATWDEEKFMIKSSIYQVFCGYFFERRA